MKKIIVKISFMLLVMLMVSGVQTAGERTNRNSSIRILVKDYGRNVVVFFSTVITVENIGIFPVSREIPNKA